MHLLHTVSFVFCSVTCINLTVPQNILIRQIFLDYNLASPPNNFLNKTWSVPVNAKFFSTNKSLHFPRVQPSATIPQSLSRIPSQLTNPFIRPGERENFELITEPIIKVFSNSGTTKRPRLRIHDCRRPRARSLRAPCSHSGSGPNWFN